MRLIELLSPAKTASIGIEAIRHGADAVYIGSRAFGARAAAGNSVEDIARLVQYAHQFKAKVYVTVNTIIFDEEMQEVERLIWDLWDVHVDALIIQDLRLLSLNLPPIPLHASTQMDNRTVDKVQTLASLGLPQVVLARELTTDKIREIHEACPDTALEVFVHGALCVGLSGRCNASEVLFGRSANRGECAQVCRMQFDLIADGQVIQKGRHLLSLRDNCQLHNLESLLLAGASSLKIEGRLKDVDYVKNITAAYSMALDKVIAKHPDRFCRASSGHTTYTFEPDVYKSFNRGFVKSTNKPEANFDTPKSMGEPISSPRGGRERVLHNGDGLCYIDKNGELKGFRINNVEKFRPIPGIRYFRNQDVEWDRLLSKPSAERKIYVDITINEKEVRMADEDGFEASLPLPMADGGPDFELARTHQAENIVRQLSKLGGTIFEAKEVNVQMKKNYFIPSSMLSQWRHELTDNLLHQRLTYYPQQQQPHEPTTIQVDTPYELTHDRDVPVMICHHCIRRQLGSCLREGGRRQDLSLRLGNGKTFRLDFDCKNCLMKLYLQ